MLYYCQTIIYCNDIMEFDNLRSNAELLLGIAMLLMDKDTLHSQQIDVALDGKEIVVRFAAK